MNVTTVKLPTSTSSLYVKEGELGLGLFSTLGIQKGTVILAFSGPIIDFDSAVAKGDHECWPLQLGSDVYMDLCEPGCYANHSCEPCAGIVDDMYLVAIRDIFPDEEIRYDYSTSMDEDHFTMACKCGSGKCRLVVNDFKHIPLEVQQRYISLGVVMSHIAKQHERLNSTSHAA